MDRIILASKSIGRRELFDKYFGEYEIHVSDINESIGITEPHKLTRELARLKAAAVAKLFTTDYVMGFDTVVVFESRIIGKPKDKEEAKKFLKMLSGKVQSVISGYCIINKTKSIFHNGSEETVLHFKELSEDFIENYVNTHSVTKFAGGYAIQKDDSYIDIIDGDYDVIVGAPMKHIIDIMKILPHK